MVVVTVAGLGSMDFGMARALPRCGIAVCGSDVTSDRVEKPPRAGAARSDILLSVVLNAAQTDFARDMAARTEAPGLCDFDAPISGGVAKAAAGQVSITTMGPHAALDCPAPARNAMAATVHRSRRPARRYRAARWQSNG